MLSVTEFTDIKSIERLRLHCGRELDNYDNFSWHIALKDGKRLLGVARLYMLGGEAFIDSPCLYTDSTPHREMLTRTLLLKVQTMGITAIADGSCSLYRQYGFERGADGLLRVLPQNIIFPSTCGGNYDGHSDCKQCKAQKD